MVLPRNNGNAKVAAKEHVVDRRVWRTDIPLYCVQRFLMKCKFNVVIGGIGLVN